MSNWKAVSPGHLWGRKARSLSPEAHRLLTYIMCCDQRLSEGLYRLPLGYAASDTGMDEAALTASIKELTDAGLIEYDEEYEIVLDRRALEIAVNQPRGPKQLKGAINGLKKLPPTRLLESLMHLADELAWEPIPRRKDDPEPITFADAMRSEFQTLRKVYENTSDTPVLSSKSKEHGVRSPVQGSKSTGEGTPSTESVEVDDREPFGPDRIVGHVGGTPVVAKGDLYASASTGAVFSWGTTLDEDSEDKAGAA